MRSIWVSATHSRLGAGYVLKLSKLLLLMISAVALAETAGSPERYLEVDDYIANSFPDGRPETLTLWVAGDLRESLEQTLGHRFAALRTRYWYDGVTSAWVLDEIGKEMPITIGVTIRDKNIENVRILEFRESRGWEVKYPFFTDQFRSVSLTADGRLSRSIDGITGATLSVGAVKRVAKAALILHEHIKQTN